ncbi:hypothetical protein C5D07_13705 [Rathayibacter tritici]|nr:hypothetical protein C5D07_13705 [Rathayibacter tritici]
MRVPYVRPPTAPGSFRRVRRPEVSVTEVEFGRRAVGGPSGVLDLGEERLSSEDAVGNRVSFARAPVA